MVLCSEEKLFQLLIVKFSVRRKSYTFMEAVTVLCNSQ